MSDIRTDALGIAGIVFTIGVGFLIFYLQRRTDKKVEYVVHEIKKTVSSINNAVSRIDEVAGMQYNLADEEKKRRGHIIEYSTYHVVGNLNLIKRMLTDLRKHVNSLINNKSNNDKIRLIDLCGTQGDWIQNVSRDIKDRVNLAAPYLNNTWLTDKFLDSTILGVIGSIFLSIKQNETILDTHNGLVRTIEEIDREIEDINDYITRFNEERSAYGYQPIMD
jgi:hypothetical protein